MTRKLRTTVLIGAAALALSSVALAASRDVHHMNVELADGSVARIEYRGDIAPVLRIAQPLHFLPAAAVEPFGGSDPVNFDQMAMEMDRQVDELMREAAAASLPAAIAGQLDLAALGKLPPASVRYSFVSTTTRHGSCARTVELTSSGNDPHPRVVATERGDCAPLERRTTPTRLDGPPPSAPPARAPAAPVAAEQQNPPHMV
jgi:hypothetical protein